MKSPPRLALRVLARTLAPDDREQVMGDLAEVFADRVDAGRRFNRVWVWGQVCQFVVAAAFVWTRGASLVRRSTRSEGGHPSGRLLMNRFASGFRHAARRLRYDWRYSAATVVILAVGIGPAAAMWSVVDRVLLRPLDYREPERLGILRINLAQLLNHPGLSPAEIIDVRNAEIFESVEGQLRQSEVSFGPAGNLIALTQVGFTTGMLPMLGVAPVLGRSFTEADLPPRPGGGAPAPTGPPPPMPVMLDYTTWQTHFGGDPDVVSKTIEISGRSAVVFGVLPKGFRLVTGRAVPRRIDVYTPFQLGNGRNSWQFPTFVRLKPGTTFEQAQAGLDALAARLKRDYPQPYDVPLRFTVAPVLADMTRTTTPALRAAIGGVLLLMLIAFANATALVVARLRTRERDLAIRSAIGASRGALVGEVLSESVLLGIGGALAGSVLAYWATAAIRTMIPRTVPRWDEITVGWNLLLYSGGLAFAGLVCLGLIPVWHVSRRTTWLVLGSTSVQGGRAEGARSRLVLVGSQIAFAVVLAFGGVQLFRSASQLSRVDLGFDPDVLTMRVPYDGRRYPSPQDRAALYQRVRDRVREVPGVASVGIVTHLPLSGSTMIDGYQADLTHETSFDQSANYQAVTPGYFATVRIPILQGRDITDAENVTGQSVAVVDESLVRAVFPGESNVIGRTLRLGWQIGNVQIVGVVGHARTIEVGRQVRPQIYVPISRLWPSVTGAGFVTVRTTGDALPLANTIAEAVREAGPGRAISNVAMLSDNVVTETSTLRAVTGLVTSLALSAGLLSAIGLYLVIAFVVHQQRLSTAIRMALGATGQQVIWHHMKIGLSLMFVALPIGVLLSIAIAPLFAALLYGVGERDLVSLVLSIAIAVAVSVAGMYVPIRRAASANVLIVLRDSV